MSELEKAGFATFIDNGDGWERVPNAKFMMRDEDGTEIEMTPNEVIKQLMQDNKSLENYINNLQSKIDKVNKILNANTHVENIYHALCNLFDEEYQYEIDNEELNDILKD